MKFTMLAICVSAFMTYELCFADNSGRTDLYAGQRLVLRLTGKSAERYSSITGFPSKPIHDLTLSLPAQIEEVLENGSVRITTSASPAPSVNGKPRLLTIETTLNRSDIMNTKNEILASPADFADRGILPSLLAQEQCLSVSISELRRADMQVWELTNE